MPVVFAGMKESGEFAFRVQGRNVAALVAIAVETAKGQVGFMGFTSVLFTDDMIDLAA